MSTHHADYVVDDDYLAWVADQQKQAEKQAALWRDEAYYHRVTGKKRFRCECSEWCPCAFHYAYPKGARNDGSGAPE